MGPVTSGRNVFATPVTVLFVVTMLTGLPVPHLHERGYLPAFAKTIPTEWQFINAAEDETVARIEIR